MNKLLCFPNKTVYSKQKIMNINFLSRNTFQIKLLLSDIFFFVPFFEESFRAMLEEEVLVFIKLDQTRYHRGLFEQYPISLHLEQVPNQFLNLGKALRFYQRQKISLHSQHNARVASHHYPSVVSPLDIYQ